MITIEIDMECDYKEAQRWRMDLNIFKNKMVTEKWKWN